MKFARTGCANFPRRGPTYVPSFSLLTASTPENSTQMYCSFDASHEMSLSISTSGTQFQSTCNSIRIANVLKRSRRCANPQEAFQLLMLSTIKNRRQMHHFSVEHHLMLFGAVHFLTSMRFIRSFGAAEVLGNCRFIFVPLRGLVSLPLRGVRILEKGSIAHPYSAIAYSSIVNHEERMVMAVLNCEHYIHWSTFESKTISDLVAW